MSERQTKYQRKLEHENRRLRNKVRHLNYQVAMYTTSNRLLLEYLDIDQRAALIEKCQAECKQAGLEAMKLDP